MLILSFNSRTLVLLPLTHSLCVFVWAISIDLDSSSLILSLVILGLPVSPKEFFITDTMFSTSSIST